MKSNGTKSKRSFDTASCFGASASRIQKRWRKSPRLRRDTPLLYPESVQEGRKLTARSTRLYRSQNDGRGLVSIFSASPGPWPNVYRLRWNATQHDRPLRAVACSASHVAI